MGDDSEQQQHPLACVQGANSATGWNVKLTADGEMGVDETQDGVTPREAAVSPREAAVSLREAAVSPREAAVSPSASHSAGPDVKPLVTVGIKRRGNGKVIGDWRLERRLGSGSFAAVFLARHMRDDARAVAVKAISRAKLTRKLERNLAKEILILQGLAHRNVVGLYETHESSKHIYLVMEFCRGGDLHQLLRKRGALGQRLVRALIQQLGSGMHYLWSRNLIHRDLKPQNLLLSNMLPEKPDENELSTVSTGGTVVLKIADFGFATQLAEATMADTMCGSPLYMAPEVLAGKPYDSKADLWSAGTIMFEMLFGRPPFTGASPRELLNNIVSKRFRVDIKARQRIGKDSVTLLEGLLAADPSERIAFQDFYEHPFMLPDVQDSPAARPMKLTAKILAAPKFVEEQGAEDDGSESSSLPSSGGGCSEGSVVLEKSTLLADTQRLERAKSKQLSEDAWEIIPSANDNVSSQQKQQLRRKQPRSQQLVKTPRLRVRGESESVRLRAAGTSEQYSSSAQVIRYAGELYMRADVLGDVAQSLISEQEEGEKRNILVLKNYGGLTKILIGDYGRQLAALTLSIKAMQVLAQALEGCNTSRGFGIEALVAAARITRDDARKSYAKQLQRAKQLHAQLSSNLNVQAQQRVPTAEALMFTVLLQLGKSAVEIELESKHTTNAITMGEAHILLSSALAVLDLLCADQEFAQAPEQKTTLLGLRAAYMQRSVAAKKARSELGAAAKAAS